MTINRRSFLAGSLAALATPAKAGGMITIHLYGDSITHGYAAGAFSSEIKPSNPFWPMRSIWAVANQILEENAAPYRVDYISGKSLHPSPSSANPFTDLPRGILTPGDWVVLEDAGNHGGNPAAYMAAWLNVIDDIRRVDDVSILMMTMFDYPPAQRLAQFDTPFNGVTMNTATERAAKAAGAKILDLNALMDLFQSTARARFGVSVMHRDGVHPNAWGQAFMTGQILKAVGAGPYIRSVNTLWAGIEPNWQRYGYGAADWTAFRARALLNLSLGR
jgi:lysophospholipase L1-like esterase